MARMVDQLLVGVKYVTDQSSARKAMRSYGMIADGVAIASAATVGFVVATANVLDQTAKTARSLDLTTEAYSRYAHAADLSGVSAEQLGTGLRALTMQIGGVAQGSAEAIKNFKAVDVEVQNVDGSFRTAAEILPEVADGLNALDEGQRAAFRARLLGESGANLATLLEGGSEGIRQMTAEADALGLTLDGKTAAAAEAFVDNLTRLKAIVTGAGLQMAKVLLPAALDVSESIVKMATASDGFIRLGIDRTVRTLAFAMEMLETPAGKVAAGLVAVTAGVGAFRIAGQLLSPVLGRLGLGLGSVTAAAAPWALVIGGAILLLEDFYVTAQGGDSMTRRLADSFGYGEETAEFLRNTMLAMNKAMQATILLGGELFTLMGEGAVALGDYAASWSGVAAAVWDLSYAFMNVMTLGAFDTLLAYFDYDVWQTPLGRMLSWLSGAFDMSRAVSGFSKLISYATGGENVQLSESGSGRAAQLAVAPIVGLAESRRRRLAEGQIAEFGPGASTIRDTGVVPGNQVSVQVAVDNTDIREAAREAGRQTEREINQAAAYAEGA